MAVAPPWAIHTESRPRGNPPPGKIASSGPMPVATGSAVRCVTGVASGNLCSRSDRRSAEEDTSASEGKERTLVYTEQIPKANPSTSLATKTVANEVFFLDSERK